MTKAERKEIAFQLGKRGGRNRAKNLTPERRKEIARMGGLARAANAVQQNFEK